jgi:hypothetical protein
VDPRRRSRVETRASRLGRKLRAHPIRVGARIGPRPAAPYESDPARWPTLAWYDRRTGRPVPTIAITRGDDAEVGAHALARGDTPIQLLADVLSGCRRRAEHKSLDPAGRPAGPESSGLLQRRPIVSSPHDTELTGKEGNKVDERIRGEAEDPAEYSNARRRSDTWALTLTVLREIGAPAIVTLTGYSRSAACAVLHGTRPRGERARVL